MLLNNEVDSLAEEEHNREYLAWPGDDA